MRELSIIWSTNEFDDKAEDEVRQFLSNLRSFAELELLKDKREGSVRVEITKVKGDNNEIF